MIHTIPSFSLRFNINTMASSKTNPLKREVLKIAQQFPDRTGAQIARELGLNSRTVQRWLEESTLLRFSKPKSGRHSLKGKLDKAMQDLKTDFNKKQSESSQYFEAFKEQLKDRLRSVNKLAEECKEAMGALCDERLTRLSNQAMLTILVQRMYKALEQANFNTVDADKLMKAFLQSMQACHDNVQALGEISNPTEEMPSISDDDAKAIETYTQFINRNANK